MKQLLGLPFEICSCYIKGQWRLCWPGSLAFLASPVHYSRTHNFLLPLTSDHLPLNYDSLDPVSPREKTKNKWLKTLNSFLAQHKDKLSNWMVEKVL